jgi:hypothetical protein
MSRPTGATFAQAALRWNLRNSPQWHSGCGPYVPRSLLPSWPLSVVLLPRLLIVGAAVDDPNRRFDIDNCRIAKGLFTCADRYDPDVFQIFVPFLLTGVVVGLSDPSSSRAAILNSGAGQFKFHNLFGLAEKST